MKITFSGLVIWYASYFLATTWNNLLALKYGFVTDLTSLVVEENEKYRIKIHNPEKFKYDVIGSSQVDAVISLTLDTPSDTNFPEIKSKLAESGKKLFSFLISNENGLPIFQFQYMYSF